MLFTFKPSTLIAALGAAMLSIATSGAQAALTPYDLNGDLTPEAYYDSVTALFWTQNANINGPMNWADAKSWAEGLTIGGASDWRLPTVDIDCRQVSGAGQGYACGTLTGELNQFYYYTLGGGGEGASPAGIGTHNSNYDLFSNVVANRYWSSLPWSATPDQNANPHPDFAYFLGFGNGTTFGAAQTDLNYAWAVSQSLPSSASVVPEPANVAMMLAGLGVMGALRRRRSK